MLCSFRYPKNLHYKIFQRRGQCLTALGRHAEAEAAGKPMVDHVTHLIVHGVLHLLGYDHERDGDATLMERLEVEILGKLGLDDPYRDDAVQPPA